MDKSRKSRASLQTGNEEFQLKVLENVSPNSDNETNIEEEVTFVDNDIYERDSNAEEESPFTAVNFNVDDETYEIPENNRLSLPVIPVRTTSSPKPALPQRMSFPVWNTKQSGNVLDVKNNNTESHDASNGSEVKPKLPPRKSAQSPEVMEDSLAVPMPIKSHSNEESTSESESDSSNSESDFEDLPPPITQAPLPPEGGQQGACGGFDPNESEYLEPISHMDDSDVHDYDPVYIPSNPGESHMVHLIDETNYIKGKRNRSASKASLNPYEEIEFGDMDEPETENSNLLTIDNEPPPPPKLTPRSSRHSGASPLPSPRLPPRLDSVFNSPISNNKGQIPSQSHNGENRTAPPPKLKPRSPVNKDLSENESCSDFQIVPPQFVESVAQQEPRYSGLLECDEDSDIDGHDYTPLDHTAEDSTTEGMSKKEAETNVKSDHDVLINETADAQIYEPIEDQNGNDEIYEPIEFHPAED